MFKVSNIVNAAVSFQKSYSFDLIGLSVFMLVVHAQSAVTLWPIRGRLCLSHCVKISLRSGLSVKAILMGSNLHKMIPEFSLAGVIPLKRAAFPFSSLPANTAPLIFAWYNYKHMWQGLTPHIILYSGVFQSPYLTRLSKNCHTVLCKASTVLNGWRLCGWCIAMVSHRNLLCWTPSLASCTNVFCWNANMHTGKSIPFTLRWVCFSWLQDMHKGGVRFLEEKLML